MGRLGLHGQDGRDQREGSHGLRKHEQKVHQKQEAHGRGKGKEQDAFQDPRSGRAHLRCGQERIRIQEGSLQGSFEEHQQHPCSFCIIEPLHGQEETAFAPRRGVVSLDMGEKAKEGGKRGDTALRRP